MKEEGKEGSDRATAPVARRVEDNEAVGAAPFARVSKKWHTASEAAAAAASKPKKGFSRVSAHQGPPPPLSPS